MIPHSSSSRRRSTEIYQLTPQGYDAHRRLVSWIRSNEGMRIWFVRYPFW